MPYIEPKERKYLDPLIDKLSEKIAERSKNSEHAFAGLLNYVCTRLALQVMRKKFAKIHYWTIALVGGVFHNIADEFYRRIGCPYEDKKIKENTDVDLYEKYVREIKSKKNPAK